MSDFAERIEALAAQAIIIDTQVNGKSGITASYTVRKELCNEDGYYEGDGGCVELGPDNKWLPQRPFGEYPTPSGEYPMFFDSISKAVAAAENAGKAK